MQAYFGEVASECILIKRAPSWIQTWKRLGERRERELVHFPHPLPTHFSQVNMAANSNMATHLRPRALKKTPALQARRAMTQFVLVVQSLPKSPRSYFCLFRAM